MRRRLLLQAASAVGAVSVMFPVEPMMAVEPSAVDRLTRAFFFLDEDEEEGDDGEGCDPVRVVQIRGPLVHHASWWWCSYEDVCHEFQEALDDPTCEAVVLRIDSPGGYVAGMGEAIRSMREAKVRAGKPVLAYVNECACSAGYGLATVADEIWLPASGMVGSVGAILTVYDESEANKKLGLRVVVIASGEHKTDGHPDVPLSSAALERIRERVFTHAGLFVAQVAEARRMTTEALVALKAGVFLGAKAIEAGLADRLASLDETLAEAARRGAAAKASRSAPLALSTPGASAPQPHETQMKLLLAKLGLPETATEGEAVAALSAQTTTLQQVLSLTGATSADGAIGVVRAWKDGSAQTAALKAQLEGVQKAKEDAEKAALCDKLRTLGYSKAQVEQLAASMSLDGLRGYATVATPQAHAQEAREPGSGGATPASNNAPLTPEEQRACAHLGLTEEEFRKEKALTSKGVN